MSYAEIWDFSYARGAAAFREYCRRGPGENSVEPMSSFLITNNQELANMGLDADMFDEQLTHTAFRCGWADTEQSE